MKDVIQLPLLTQEHKAASRFVLYISPTLEEVNQYAHSVCLELARRANAAPPSTEVLRGFAAFINTVISTHVSYLNRQNAGGTHATEKVRQT